MKEEEKLLKSFSDLEEKVIHCRLCPRLVHFREHVPARASFKDEPYWRKPIPGFGDPNAWLLIVGLAPAAHGGNRTGRIFTGDDSGRFLYHALYEEGFASQPLSEYKDDGLTLKGCYITAAVKCAPPQNKPAPKECLNCSRYLHKELYLLKKLKAVLALGRLAFDAYRKFAKLEGEDISHFHFKHGGHYKLKNLPPLYASYHPSPQNVNTGKLTDEMFRKVLRNLK